MYLVLVVTVVMVTDRSGLFLKMFFKYGVSSACTSDVLIQMLRVILVSISSLYRVCMFSVLSRRPFVSAVLSIGAPQLGQNL